MALTPELVVLLDDDGVVCGASPKHDVHGTDTPLHLAFSCYISNAAGQLLLTRRALTKQTWPGVWTNSVCGHPAPGEALNDAVERRVAQELGATISNLQVRLPRFRYRATDASGIVENELCPVFTAEFAGNLEPAANEVCELAWIAPDDLVAAVASAPFAFSPWLREQLPLLLNEGAFTSLVRS